MGSSRIGRYETKELLGVGGFASVFKAFDPRLEDTVAIKVLAENWSQVPDIRKRFRSEAVMLRRLQTEYEVSGFVNVFDIDETPSGQPFFVMTYADRGTLAERVEIRPWSLENVLPFAQNISHSLSRLHQLGYIHRDIKPSNIFFRSNGHTAKPTSSILQPDERILISDLGMAKDLNNQTMSGLSLAGGTPMFMAPEQNAVGSPIDHRADVYAASVLLKLLIAEPSQALSETLAEGMSPDPADRPQTMDSWFDLVRSTVAAPTPLTPVEALTEPPPHPHVAPPAPNTDASPNTGVTPLAEVTDPTPPKAKPRPRKTIAVASAILALIAVVGASLYFLARPGSRIVGPGTIEVGQTVTYRADVDPASSISWTDWNGENIQDEGLVITPRLPGELTFFLTAEGRTSQRSITVEASDESPTVIGPSSSTVGEPITLSAELEDGTSRHYWLDPDGNQIATEQLTLTPSTPGEITVVVVAVDTDGVERGERHSIDVSNG